MNNGYFHPSPMYSLPTGLEVVMLHHNQVCVLRLTRADRTNIDGFWAAYGQFMAHSRAQHQTPKLIFNIGDASINPYARDVTVRHLQQYADLHMAIAVIFAQRTPFVPVVRQMLTTDIALHVPLCTLQEHDNEASALAWLMTNP